jgi:general secretion pathway protein D
VVTIGTRNLDTVLSLKDGETSIIGGLIQNTQNNTKQKIFLLGDIPLIGPLLSNHDTTKDKTELILAITPRLVRSVTVPQNNLMSFDSGKEDDPSLRRPMASFDQEPVFEGEAKPAPVKPLVRPQVTPQSQGMPPSPPPVGAAPPTAAPAADVTKPVGDAVKQPVPVGPQGITPSAAIVPVPTPAVTGAATTVTPAAAPIATPTATPASKISPAFATQVVPPPAKRGLVQIAAPAGIDVGQQFNVDIKAGDVQNLAGVFLVLNYDPKIVDYVSAAEGSFLKKDGKPTIYSATANVAKGTLLINLSRTPDSGGVSGAGTLVSAQFRAKAKGAASFGFQRANFTSADGNPLEMLPFSTAVNVR